MRPFSMHRTMEVSKPYDWDSRAWKALRMYIDQTENYILHVTIRTDGIRLDACPKGTTTPIVGAEVSGTKTLEQGAMELLMTLHAHRRTMQYRGAGA